MLLDPTDNRQMRTFGNKHELTLKNVRETDFGNYSCMADNSLGRERGSIEVSGRPHASKIVSNSLGSFKDQYNLTWTVNSFLPIEEYRILYRVNTVSFKVLLYFWWIVPQQCIWWCFSGPLCQRCVPVCIVSKIWSRFQVLQQAAYRVDKYYSTDWKSTPDIPVCQQIHIHWQFCILWPRCLHRVRGYNSIQEQGGMVWC